MINHSFSKEIIITKKDILPLVYFIISMFQQENTHRQGTSSKSDLIGGYLDRWINKIPENIIFNKFILEDKPYTVVNDYFIYGAQSDKNAPDILGIKSGNRLIKFAEFEDDTWKQCSGMPHIEVKTFRRNQKLVSVRETQLKDDNFYVFVESDFNSDYLLQLFDSEIYGNEVLDKIVMDWDFVRSNKKSIIMQPQSLKRNADDIIGTLKLISIIKGNDIRKNAVCCGEKENMYYIKNISEALRITSPLKESEQKSIYEFFKGDSIDLWNGIKMTPINCNKPKDVIIKKVNKKSLYCEALVDCTIYDFHLEAGKKYKIDLEVFERSSGWTEFVALKNQFVNSDNRIEELITHLDTIATQ